MAYFKNIYRTITKNLYRYIALILITFIGVCFVSGIGGISAKVENTIALNMEKQNAADVIIKNRGNDFTSLGFTSDDQEKIKAKDEFSEVAFFTSFETMDKNLTDSKIEYDGMSFELNKVNISFSDRNESNFNGRYYSYPFESSLNKLELVEGRYPEKENEVVVEQKSLTIKDYKIGDIINFSFKIDGSISIAGLDSQIPISFSNNNREYKVVGIVLNPLMYSKRGDELLTEDYSETEEVTGNYLKCIMYASKNDNPLPYLDYSGFTIELFDSMPITDCFVKFKDTLTLDPFSKEYRSKVDEIISTLQKDETFSEKKVAFLDYSKNKSYQLTYRLNEKINIIVDIFPALFILVVLLVTVNNLTKMISDDRNSIGCLKSLGYSNFKIIFKYIFFSFSAIFIGALAGLLTGIYTIPNVFLPAFTTMFILGETSSKITYFVGLISAVVILFVTQLSVFFIALKNVKDSPASLLLPKAPKPGKKILLERMPRLWNKLKFKTKSCFRNIFRYKGRLLMTIFSTALSTALVMGGFGLWDISKDGIKIKSGFTLDAGNTILYVSLIVLFFAMILAILVLYNIINMNIDERRKEIATLKVLGYRNGEVYSYIFKDVIIMASIGIIIGVPLGVLLLWYIFNSLGFGGINEVHYYSYILAFVLSFAFIFVVFLMMIRKMRNINMSDSLQAKE